MAGGFGQLIALHVRGGRRRPRVDGHRASGSPGHCPFLPFWSPSLRVNMCTCACADACTCAQVRRNEREKAIITLRLPGTQHAFDCVVWYRGDLFALLHLYPQPHFPSSQSLSGPRMPSRTPTAVVKPSFVFPRKYWQFSQTCVCAAFAHPAWFEEALMSVPVFLLLTRVWFVH